MLIGAAGIRNRRNVYKFTLKSVSKVIGFAVPRSWKTKFYKIIGSDYGPELSAIHKKVIARTLGCDVQADAVRITVPSLLIYGTRDTATPPDFGRTFARLIPVARLELVEGEQHWVHQTAAREVAQLIREFHA